MIQPVAANYSTTSLADTNKYVLLPIDVARKAAIDLERFDFLKVKVLILEKLTESQAKEIGLKNREIDLHRKIDERQNANFIELNTLNSQLSMQFKKKQTENKLLKVGIVVAFIAGVLVSK